MYFKEDKDAAAASAHLNPQSQQDEEENVLSE